MCNRCSVHKVYYLLQVISLNCFLKTINSIDVIASVYPTGTSVNDISLLLDCKVFCLPDSSLYFSTGLQTWPHLIFDLRKERIVYGLQIFLRTDDPKYVQGNSGF